MEKITVFERSTVKKIKFDSKVSKCFNKKFEDYLKENGIQRLSKKYTLQQNGVVARKLQTLIEKAMCLLIGANSPLQF